MLMAATSTKLLILVDKLERLGLAYHFETEIEDKLKRVYEEEEEDDDDYDLFTTALRFRLLRQHQFHVSCSTSSLINLLSLISYHSLFSFWSLFISSTYKLTCDLQYLRIQI